MDALLIYRRGSKENKECLKEWLGQGVLEDAERQVRVAGDWSNHRQIQWGDWCQLLGLSCHWEGGYLFVQPNKAAVERIRWAASPEAESVTLPVKVVTTIRVEEEEGGGDALPSPPKPSSAASVNRLVEGMSRVTLENRPVENVRQPRASIPIADLYDDDDDAHMLGHPTTTARNRPRKWQQSLGPVSLENKIRFSTDVAMRRLSSAVDPLRRKSSISSSMDDLARRSSIGINSDFTLTGLEKMRKPALLSVKEEPVSKKKLAVVVQRKAPPKPIATWTEASVLRIVFQYLSPIFLLHNATQVSKSWEIHARSAANAAFARNPTMFLNPEPCFKVFGNGRFLADGAYKQVYRVRNQARSRDEAVSVMDVNRIRKLGDPAVVAREVNVALVLSELVAGDMCPNFIETYQVFQLNFAPPYCWGSSEDLVPSADSLIPASIQSQKGPHQYIRMELCTMGDLEEYMKTLPGGVIPLKEAQGVIFQMVYSLYAARRAVKMRHYDVKCLNFFCTSFGAETSKTWAVDDNRWVRLNSDCQSFVKLADYGTADLSTETLGKPVDVCHFTTLENTPIDFLLHSKAPQAFAADTFQLGLSILHVMTGASPYEEILESVKCPTALMDAVANVWEEGTEFDTLRCVLRDDDDNILFHTLYRYFVMFGLPTTNENESSNDLTFSPVCSRVYAAVVSVLVKDVDMSSQKTLKAKNAKAARKQYALDFTKFSFRSGTHHLMTRGRERSKALGIWDLLWSCLEFDPKRRITPVEALRSSAFQSLFIQAIPETDETVYGLDLFAAGKIEAEDESCF